jgi:DNA repair protein RadA/Sms
LAKKSVEFVCQSCGTIYPRWQGKCDSCGEWNSINEERTATEGLKTALNRKKGNKIEFVSLEGAVEQKIRTSTGMDELNRVCGGGLVAGSVILVGGDPGIGKSTILLQASASIANQNKECFYISGEEAIDQVRLRAKRLGLDKSNVKLASATNVRDIITTLNNSNPDVVIIDSIQTMFLDTIDSAPGTVSQVRDCGYELIKLAKKKGFALFLVGHVTKQGNLAGPRILEHMVDTVLYFEGDRGHQFRILRAVKNRFGATDEIGVFEMSDMGLKEVANPSAIFLAERQGNISGSCVFAGIEGSRPVLVEIQALVSNTSYPSPKRAVVGWDHNRLSMVLAVLEARCGINLSGQDIYLNIAGGLKISEPAADLAVAMAILSSLHNKPIPHNMIIFGEIGLSGEIRAVSQIDSRLKESKKLGFELAIIPPIGKKKANGFDENINQIGNVQKLINWFG